MSGRDPQGPGDGRDYEWMPDCLCGHQHRLHDINRAGLRTRCFTGGPNGPCGCAKYVRPLEPEAAA